MGKSLLDTLLKMMLESEMKKHSDCKIQIEVKDGVMTGYVEGYGFGIVIAFIESLANHLLEEAKDKESFEEISTATVSLLKSKLEQGAREKWQ